MLFFYYKLRLKATLWKVSLRFIDIFIIIIIIKTNMRLVDS